MSNKMKDRIPLYKLMSIFLLAVLALTACATTTPAPTQDVGQIQTQAVQTTVAILTASAPTPFPTQVPAPGPTPSDVIANAVIPVPNPGEPSATANFNNFIYSGPGTAYVVYASFLGGHRAVVVGRNEDASWWAISIPVAPTGTGWVSAGWVTVADVDNVPILPAPPVPPTTELVPPGPGDPQAVALVNTFVRTGPGENFPAFGIAEPGISARVIARSTDGQWWSVRIGTQIVGAGHGWVSAPTVQVSNAENVPVIASPPAPIVAVPVPPADGAPRAMAVDFINIRSGPGTVYPTLGTAAPGAVGEVSGVSTDKLWWQVKVPAELSADGFGWVSSSFVLTENTAGVPVVPAPPVPEFPQTPPTTNQCSLLAQSPADHSAMAADTSFNAIWTLRNTGTETWTTDSYDVRFLGASVLPFHEGSDIYNLSSNVETGWNYAVSIPMVAPSNAGTYGEAWAIVSGSTNVCTFWIWVEVK